MPEIDQLLRRAAVRLVLVRLLRVGVVGVGLGVALIVLTRIAERLFSFPIDWGLTWAGVMGASVLGSIAWVVVTRQDRLGVAREVDERADLRESIGTALCVMGREDGWSRATVEHARGVSRRVLVRQLFPFTMHRSWPVPVVGAFLFLVLGLLPQADLLSLLETAEAREQRSEEITTAKEQVETAEKQVKEALKDLDVEGLDDGLGSEEDLTGAKTPDEIRRNKIKQLTTLQDKLAQLEMGEKAEGVKALSDRMRKLRQPDGGPSELGDMVKAMQKGDFEAASKALDDLAKKLAQGDLTDAQKKALAEQMKKLSEQMNALAEQRDALERQLEKMGLDKSLAGDPEALKKAMENMDNLTPEQKEQLQKMANAAESACKQCQSMASACQNAAASMAKGESGLDGLDKLAGQLSAAEMMQQEMNSLSAAQQMISQQLQGLGQCMGGSPDVMDIYKKWSESGMSAGGRGTGGGKQPDGQEADYKLNPDRAKTNFDPDTPIIGETMMQGELIRGESAQEFRDAVKTSSDAASEAIETKVIPREFHEAVKHYFSQLEEEGDEAAGEKGEGAESEEEKPESSKDG